jgi:hypothetical protein
VKYRLESRGFKSRRQFLGVAAATMAGAMATLTGCGKNEVDAFLQHNFRELSPDEIRQVIARLEQEAKAKYGRTSISATSPPCRG